MSETGRPAVNPHVNPDHLARFDPLLRHLLDAELEAGNEISETGSGWPKPDSITVKLRKPFLIAKTVRPDAVEYRDINDPHWWKAEFEHGGDLLMCDF